MITKINIGVIGAGVFGSYHAGKCIDHAEVEMAGLYDPDISKLTALADKLGTKKFTDLEKLFQSCDAVIIAAPAIHHGDLALKAIDAGLHVLVEKPLATKAQQARDIVKAASAAGTYVQVGHQERYVVRAIGLDQLPENPVLINAERLSPFNVRGTDTSVTLDLMSHDIDLVHWLMGATPKTIASQTFSDKTSLPDRSFAHLIFDKGEAFLQASRLADASHRVMEITYPSGTVRIDFNQKSLDNNTPFKLNAGFANAPEAKDSLAAGMNEFVTAIKSKNTPFISAADGCKAVETALKIDGDL